jgi:hypothetical protein
VHSQVQVVSLCCMCVRVSHGTSKFFWFTFTSKIICEYQIDRFWNGDWVRPCGYGAPGEEEKKQLGIAA